MDRNSIIGWVLIALLMIGFFGYQSRQIKKQQAWQAQLDSLARVEQARQDSIRAAYLAEHPEDTVVAALPVEKAVYSDSLLNAAALAEAQTVTLENEKLEIVFTTLGAQPFSVRVKDYKTYDKEDLYILKDGQSQLGFVVYAPTAVDTRKFNFQYVPAASTDSTVVMRLPFSNGGYIEQKYTLVKDSYSVNQTLSFVDMQDLIPRNVGSIDVDFDAVIPRMEKGYKNESQYSRLNYYFPDDKKPESIGNGRKGNKRFDNKIEWFAFQQQFFSAIMRAPKVLPIWPLDGGRVLRAACAQFLPLHAVNAVNAAASACTLAALGLAALALSRRYGLLPVFAYALLLLHIARERNLLLPRRGLSDIM